MPKILITGVNSFIGNGFIRLSKYKNTTCISLTNCDPTDIDFSSIDVVIHVAGILPHSSETSENQYFEVNYKLTCEIANYTKKSGVRHFIFLSTISVYGDYQPDASIWSEKSICRPVGNYGKSKYEAELALKELEDNNFIISIVRTPLVYGEGVKATMLDIIKLIDKVPVLPFGKIRNKRYFTAIDNLIELIDLLIEKKVSGVFIAMDDLPLSTTDLVKFIAEALSKKIYLISLPKFLIGLGKKIAPQIFDRLYGSLIIDNSYTQHILNYKPVIRTEDAIKKMVHTYISSKKNKLQKH